MFGRIEFEAQAAPGQGVISSVVLISEDLDEIDIEWVGSDTNQVQSNYFSKGDTSTYDRGGFHPVEAPQEQFHNYSIDWTKDQVVWSIDGNAVRTLVNTGNNYYPQSPMQVRFGSWAGGDPGNSEGTIEWAGGEINYSQGPYNFYVKTISVQDYSTGKEYAYTDHSGTWMSIQAIDGNVNGNLNSDGSVKPDEEQPETSSTNDNSGNFNGVPRNNSGNNDNNVGNSNDGSQSSSSFSSNSESFSSTVGVDANPNSSSSFIAAEATPTNSPTLSFVPSANGPSLTSAPAPPITTVSTPDGGIGFVISTIWGSDSDSESDSNNGASTTNSGTMTFEFEEGDSTEKLNRLHDARGVKIVSSPLPSKDVSTRKNVIFNAEIVQCKSNDNSATANAANKIERIVAASTAGLVGILCVALGGVLF